MLNNRTRVCHVHSKLLTCCFICDPELSWKKLHLRVRPKVVWLRKAQAIIRRQLYGYAEFNNDFLYRVVIPCQINIKTYLASLLFLKLVLARLGSWGSCIDTGLRYEHANYDLFKCYFS